MAVLLRTNEEASCEDERSLHVVVSLEHSTVRGALVKSTISVMDLKMCQLGSIGFDVNSIHWHSVRVGAENSRFVHIVPEAVHVVAAFEHFEVEKTAPEVLSVRVEEIDPGGVSGPTVTIERSRAFRVGANEDVRDIVSWLFLVLHFHSFGVDEVVIRCLDVRVNNDDDATTLSFDLRVHLFNRSVSKVLGIELEILVAIRVVILLRPFNIRPQDIDREFVIREFSVAVHKHVSRNRSPLAEMISEMGD